MPVVFFSVKSKRQGEGSYGVRKGPLKEVIHIFFVDVLGIRNKKF